MAAMTNENEFLRQFLNPNPPDITNSRGDVYISTSYLRNPTVCALCGANAVSFSAMGGLNMGLCETHKEGSIAIGGGEPISVIFEGKIYIAKGGDE